MYNSKNILFICHDSNRSGAPLYLLSLIKWLSANKTFNLNVLFTESGPLVSDFKKYSNILIYNKSFSEALNIPNSFRFLTWILNNRLSQKIYLQNFKKTLASQKIDLIYSNTITNGFLVNLLLPKNIPIITHVHESEYQINLYGKDNLNHVLSHTQKYIACSKHVINNLVSNLMIEKSKVHLIYSSIMAGDLGKPKMIESLEKKFKGKIVVGASGSLDWRKGYDLVIPLIRELLKFNSSYHFIWIGINKNSLEYEQLQFEIEKSGLSNEITLIENTSSPIDYYSYLDYFVLLSREDSFPLVCLELTLMGKPIFCFKNSGGACELLVDIPHNIIDYLDVGNMAKQINFIDKEKKLQSEIVNRLKIRVSENYLSENNFNDVYNLISDTLNL